MKRRTFLQAAAVAGLTVMVPKSIRTARAESGSYGGPYWVFINAGGGWDPTSTCDPKGGAQGDRMSVNQNYAPQDIGQSNGHRYAPIGYSATQNMTTVEVYSNKRFFDAHGQRFLVVNGVDTTTNNHDTGSRITWSGQQAEGYPAFGALVAGVVNRELSLPMPFLSYGGYDGTQGCCPLTRAGSVAALQRLAYPNRTDATQQMSPTYHTPTTYARIREAQQKRVQAMQGQPGSLPYTRQSQAALYLARSSDSGLTRLADALNGRKIVTPADLPDLAPVAGQLGGLTGLLQQAQLAVVAFQAGVAVSVNMNIGGFDTHSDHDNQHTRQLMYLLRGVDYLISEATAAGIADKLYIVIGSDFGRTPYYNDGNGKDHWNITSMLFAGPGIQGGRTIGGTDDKFKPLNVNPQTLALDDGGKRIYTTDVHVALRRLAKIDSHPLAQQFPIAGEGLPLFG
jgi:uncharacterized protein (DUF1501 family)